MTNANALYRRVRRPFIQACKRKRTWRTPAHKGNQMTDITAADDIVAALKRGRHEEYFDPKH
jgi:hypothetical protein